MRAFLDDHFAQLLGLALIVAGSALCILDGSPHSEQLGEQLLACGLLAVNLNRAPADDK
jgi:glucose dehydrogenase